MKNNNQPMTPSGLFSNRLRFNSINSPFISPLQIIQSPCFNDGTFIDGNQANAELNHFQLEDQPPLQNNIQQPQKEASEHHQLQSSLICPAMMDAQNDKDLLLDQSNMLHFVLHHVNRNNQLLDEARQNLQGYGTEFTKRLFDYLVNKFKKLKKTKEEMVKYCIRKSFKHITNKMRAADKESYINMENNQVVAEYFQMHCQGDMSISMPFKKNSQQKTMNSNFLKKIFKCRQYNIDYRQFMKHFPDEYYSDNQKKIKSLNDVIKKCARNKCFKSLDEYKRLPWSQDLLEKIFQFAKQLMEHSPYSKQNLQSKIQQNKNPRKIQKSQIAHKHEGGVESSNMQDQFQIIKSVPKKNVIILTPPMRAISDPVNDPQNNSLPDIDLL